MLWAVRYGVRTLVERRNFIFCLLFPTGPGAGPAFSAIDTVYRDVALITPPLPSAEFKNEWSYTLPPSLCLLWRVVGLPAERMLAYQEASPLGF